MNTLRMYNMYVHKAPTYVHVSPPSNIINPHFASCSSLPLPFLTESLLELLNHLLLLMELKLFATDLEVSLLLLLL